MRSARPSPEAPLPERKGPMPLAALEARLGTALRSRLRREQNPQEWFACWLLTLIDLLEGREETTRLNKRLLHRHLRQLQQRPPELSTPAPSSKPVRHGT